METKDREKCYAPFHFFASFNAQDSLRLCHKYQMHLNGAIDEIILLV